MPSAASSPPAPSQPGSRRDPLIGRTIAGRFEILDVIARGGMGKVYLAEQAPLGRTCALKVLSPKYDGEEEPEFQRRFFLEASTASKLTHPNTVTIFDYGRDDDTYYIAMEYVRGRTLFKVLRDEGPLDESRVARIMQQVARSLREAHALGVIHRDMKPANIVLVEGGDEPDRVKVLDFGLVKDVTGGEDVEDLTQQGLFMGSPKYMAPEQILGNEVSPATDVYSLGVVAFELLTGRVPFDCGASVKTLMAHVNDPVPTIRDANPEVIVSLQMQTIVARCLAKDPSERFPDMEALLLELTAVEGGGHLTESLRNARPVDPNLLSGPRPKIRPALESEPDTRLLSRSSAPPSGRRTSQPPSQTPAAMAHPIEPAPKARHKGPWIALGLVVAAASAAGLALRPAQELPSEPLAAAPPAPKPEQAAPPENEPSPSVQVLIATEPSGAQVFEDGRLLCKETPCNVVFEGEDTTREHALELRKKGFRPAALTVASGQSKATATLARVQPVAAPRPAAPVPPPPSKPKGLSGYKDSPY